MVQYCKILHGELQEPRQNINQTLDSQKDTPYLALTGELSGIFCKYLLENWPRYNSTALYFERFYLCCTMNLPSKLIAIQMCMFHNEITEMLISIYCWPATCVSQAQRQFRIWERPSFLSLSQLWWTPMWRYMKDNYMTFLQKLCHPLNFHYSNISNVFSNFIT